MVFSPVRTFTLRAAGGLDGQAVPPQSPGPRSPALGPATATPCHNRAQSRGAPHWRSATATSSHHRAQGRGAPHWGTATATPCHNRAQGRGAHPGCLAPTTPTPTGLHEPMCSRTSDPHDPPVRTSRGGLPACGSEHSQRLGDLTAFRLDRVEQLVRRPGVDDSLPVGVHRLQVVDGSLDVLCLLRGLA